MNLLYNALYPCSRNSYSLLCPPSLSLAHIRPRLCIGKNSSDCAGVVYSAQIGGDGRLRSANYYAYNHRQEQHRKLLRLPDQASQPDYGSTSIPPTGNGRHSSAPILSGQSSRNHESADEDIVLNKPCVILFLLVVCAMFFTSILYVIGMSIGERRPSFPQPISSDERERYRNSGIYWDSARKFECLDSYHFRQYTAQLQNVSLARGFNPTKACQSLPIEINGQNFEIPDQCRQVGVHMYGFWGVYDLSDCTVEDEIERYRKSGMSWGVAVPAEHCHSYDKREFEARLNTLRGYDRKKACDYIPATIQDQELGKPDSCELRMDGIYGKWVINNQLDCKPYWGPLHDRGCQASGKKRYEAELWNLVPGDDLYMMCSTTPATWHGRNYEHPTTCDYRGPKRGGMFGIWDIEYC